MLIRPRLNVPRLTNFRWFVDCLKLSLCSFVSVYCRTLVSGCILAYLEDYYNKLLFLAQFLLRQFWQRLGAWRLILSLQRKREKCVWYWYTINALKYFDSYLHVPIPVAAPSKAWVCGLCLLGIAGLNPAGGMDVSCECRVLSGTDL